MAAAWARAWATAFAAAPPAAAAWATALAAALEPAPLAEAIAVEEALAKPPVYVAVAEAEAEAEELCASCLAPAERGVKVLRRGSFEHTYTYMLHIVDTDSDTLLIGRRQRWHEERYGHLLQTATEQTQGQGGRGAGDMGAT